MKSDGIFNRGVVKTRDGASVPLGALVIAQWLCVSASIFGVLAASFAYHELTADPLARFLGITAILLSYPFFSGIRVFDFEATKATTLIRVSAAWVCVILSLTAVTTLVGAQSVMPTSVLLYWTFGTWALLVVQIILSQRLLRWLFANGLRSQPCMVLGSGDWADLIAAKVQQSPEWQLECRVPLEPEGESMGRSNSRADIRRLIKQHRVKRVFIALSGDKLGDVSDVYVDFLDLPVDLVWVPHIGNRALLNQSIGSYEGLPAVYLNESPLTMHPSAALLKGLIDRFVALALVLVLLPVFIGCSLAVRSSSPGEIFFKQARHGLNGRIFYMLKFRSMRVHDTEEVVQATKTDSRVTPVGGVLRRTSLDELPQLFNVVAGDMSLVGPRPHATAHNDYYEDRIQAYMVRHKVKPGMTGWAQVNGARGETETLEKMKQRVEYDLEYINHWSLWLDFEILLKTPRALFRGDAY